MSENTASQKWGIYGHHEVISRLQTDVMSESPAHAYLFAGPEGVGRTTTALAFARALNCERDLADRPCGECRSCRSINKTRQHHRHPDVTIADLEWQHDMFGGSGNARQQFSIEAVRWLRQNIGTRPVAGRWKIQIIDDADRFSDVAPDAFLKTLEEPPPYAVIILIANSPESVAETVRSRCRLISFGLVSDSDIHATLTDRDLPSDEAERYVQIAGGHIAKAISLVGNEKAMQQRIERINEAFEHVTVRIERLRIAGAIATNHTRNRDRTFALLDTYAGIWRDALLLRSGLSNQLTYPEVRTGLETYIQEIDTRDLYRALKATQRCMTDLESNFQARIALQAMVMQWPA